MIMEQPFDDEKWWNEVGASLNHLIGLLEQAPADSLHLQQSQSILGSVRPCVDVWMTLGNTRRAGRPRGRFLVSDDEELFVSRLTRLITERFDPVHRDMTVMNRRVKCHYFFAWIYDFAVSLGMASGRNDLTAFFNLVMRAVKASPHAEQFVMAMNTLNNYVKGWEAYVSGYSNERIFLHKISHKDVIAFEYRQRLTNERTQQQKVVELARQYELFPPAPDKK